MFLMQLGEILPGGIGSGVAVMVLMAMLAVFVAGLMVGRTHRHWGLPERPGLLLSTNPRPMDQIAFRLGTDRVRLRTVLSELDSITADGRFTGTAGADSVGEHISKQLLASSPALSALASLRARRGDYGPALDYIERAVEAGERDADHFRNAPEFGPLLDNPRFVTLLTRMNAEGS